MFNAHSLHGLLIVTASGVLLALAGCGSDVPHPRGQPQVVEESVNDRDSLSSHDDGEFDVADATTDSTLSTMRGGFVTAGGLFLNFNLTSITALNNEIVNRVTLSTENLHGVLPATLSQLLQNGTGNQSDVRSQSTQSSPSVVVASDPTNASVPVVASTPSTTTIPSAASIPVTVLSVVQNTANGAVIQNQNVLNLTVSNLSAFRNQQLAFAQRFSLGLVR